MRILGLIPARGGSKGVPGKNIKILHNKPLLAYTAEVALACKFLDRVVLNSDSEEIIAVGRSLKLTVPFVRSAHLATDTTPTLPVIIDTLEYFKAKGEYFDAVCLLQTTSPLRTVSFLEEAIQKFIDLGADSLISVQEVPHEYNPHWVFETDLSGFLQISTGEKNIIPRRQELPKAYHRDGSIYITKTNVILEQQSLYGEKVSYVVSPKEWYVNIDTMEDWEKAEEKIQFLNRK